MSILFFHLGEQLRSISEVTELSKRERSESGQVQIIVDTVKMEINFASKKKKSTKLKTPAKVIEGKVMKLLPPDAVSDSVQIMVTEVSCNEPDCVPLETLVIVIGQQARWADKVLKPIVEVTDSDIEGLDIPQNWNAWIEAETERKKEKALMSDNINMPVPLPPPPDNGSSNSKSSTASIPVATTLVSMKPRTDLSQNIQAEIKPIQSLVNGQAASKSISSQHCQPSSSPVIKHTPIKQAPTPKNNIIVSNQKAIRPIELKSSSDKLPQARHSSKGVRQRGCPCCGAYVVMLL